VDFDRALAGDALAARRLLNAAPKRLVAHFACLAFTRKTANPAYRELMKAAWQPGVRHLLTAFWSPKMIRRMLEQADFRRPTSRGPMTIYRPVVEETVREASAQLCWTRSRSAAVAEASAARSARPRILQATIVPADILFGESRAGEIVPRRRPSAIVVQPIERGPQEAAIRPGRSISRR
jgi:hypothetical protein